jgi:hypothetical protein
MTVGDTQPTQPVQPIQPVWEEPVSAALVPPPAPRRSGWVTTAAVVLLVVGALSALLGLVFLIIGLAFGPGFAEMMETAPGAPTDVDFAAASGILTGVMVGVGIVSIVWAATHIAAGVGILGGRGWARITGIVLSVIGLLFSLLGLVGTVLSLDATSQLMLDPEFQELYGPASEGMVGASMVTSVLFTLPFVIGYLITLIALIRNGPFFDRRSAVRA